MYTKAIFVFCVSAFIQNVNSQCYGKGGLIGPAVPVAGPAPYAPYAPLGYNAGCGAAYGGSGIGNVAIAGELPVAGTTIVAGQIPVIGAVEFGGPASAAGVIYITGTCGCGCGSPYNMY